MKIQPVRIKNFRTLKDVTIPFDSVTTFIGPNGSGKSTVLRALDWYFNGKSSSLTEKDCFFGAIDEDIEVQITFHELTEKDRSELGKYAPEGVSTFTAWKRRSPDGTESLSANSKSYPPFNAIRGKGTSAEKRAAYWTCHAACCTTSRAWRTREWVKRSEIDSGKRDGVTSSERERIKALERETKELRRANEILKSASASFVQAAFSTAI